MKRERVIKLSKATLILATALFFTIVAFNNLTDYGSNFEFVKHVLSMDTTFEGNNLLWRSITSPIVHHIFYWIIILWEIAVAILLWIAGIRLLNHKNKIYEKGIGKAIIGLTLALMLWFFAFITVGGEWFAMWQSSIWNGQDAAFRMFVINGLTLLFLMFKD